MSLILDWPREVEEHLLRKAQQRGVRVEEYLLQLVERDEPTTDTQDEITPEIAARLAALDKIGSYNTREGLPELDLSGSRADVYGYSEREDAQL